MRIVMFGLVTAFACFLPANQVLADKPGPMETYLTFSADKRFVFVMLVQGDQTSPYSRSGLYLNDGSKKPLWTVDWFAWSSRYRIIVAADGKHVVRIQNWPSLKGKRRQPAAKEELKQEGLAVYQNGKMLRSIKLHEMVDLPAGLANTITGFFWIKEQTFDDGSLLLRVETRDGNRIVVDVSTGRFTKKRIE